MAVCQNILSHWTLGKSHFRARRATQNCTENHKDQTVKEHHLPVQYVSTARDNRQLARSEEQKTISLDVRGFYCPVPVLKTREMFDSMNMRDTLQVIADDPAAESDLRNWVRFTGQKALRVQRQGSAICFSIEKVRDIL